MRKKSHSIIVLSIIAAVLLIIPIGRYIANYHIDPSLLCDTIRASNMVRIYDTESDEILYESHDEAEIRWLSESFIADRNSPHHVVMGWAAPRYKLFFYNDSKVMAEIAMKEKIRFHWYDATWSRHIDFLLTSESYCDILLWLCDKSGKSLNDLFPSRDDGVTSQQSTLTTNPPPRSAAGSGGSAN